MEFKMMTATAAHSSRLCKLSVTKDHYQEMFQLNKMREGIVVVNLHSNDLGVPRGTRRFIVCEILGEMGGGGGYRV